MMSEAFRNLLSDYAAAILTHIGLVDETGTEIQGGDPAYARKPVEWTAAADGLIRPTLDLVFDVPANTTVAGWRAYSALAGGADYGGGEFAAPEVYSGQGNYRLLAAQTGISVDAAA